MSQSSTIQEIKKPTLVSSSGAPIPVSKKSKEKTKAAAEKTVASQLPEPMGWRILIAVPEAATKTEGGILKANETMALEEVGTVCGLVVKMGSLCYKDKERFGEDCKPWCKENDFVLIGAYKGVRFKIHGKEFRIINDDTVQGVVLDPRGYSRA